ncbi:MAG: glycosyltransferase family 4 protein [Candidatus Micrarchaeia archaeon]
MKITFVSSEYKQSGVGYVTYNASRELQSLGVTVKVFVRSSVKPLEKRFVQVKPHGFFKNNLAYPFFVAKIIANEKADLWHGDVAETGFACKIAGKKPLVVSLHDIVPLLSKHKHERNPLFRVAYRIWLKEISSYAKAIIFDSKNAKRDAIKAGLPKKKLYVVYDGVDRKRFYPSAKKGKKGKIIISYAGGFGRRKRIDRLAHAMEILNKSNLEVELRIAGKANQTVKKQFSKHKVKNVKFLGFVPDKKMRDFYASSDVFAFPSDYEGFGLPVLEAMACGVPVVAINASSIPEVVKNAGILCKPDAKAFANAIMRLATNEKLRKKLSKKSIERSKQFTWKKTAEEMLEIYKKAVKSA